MNSKHFFVLICLLLQFLSLAFCDGGGWFSGSDPGKVRLQDVNVLTLKEGKMTTGRRSSPVQQLNCVGGSAQGLFRPGVVQCYNRGYDGRDFQWECKADMDNLYRFGSVEVVCEGYDYPDDPFILQGSCGLEYTLELTQEGREKQKRNNNNNNNNYYSSKSYESSSYYKRNKWSGLSDLLVLGVVGVIFYAIYKTCISSNEMGDRQYSSTNNDYPSGHPGGGGWFSGNTRNNYPSGGNYDSYDDASCAGNRGYFGRQRGTGAGGAGFWTGLATGGLAGYMFGNTGNRHAGYDRGYRGYNSGWRSGWGWGGGGGGVGGNSGFTSAGNSGSSGTRTASGFGGTRRR